MQNTLDVHNSYQIVVTIIQNLNSHLDKGKKDAHFNSRVKISLPFPVMISNCFVWQRRVSWQPWKCGKRCFIKRWAAVMWVSWSISSILCRSCVSNLQNQFFVFGWDFRASQWRWYQHRHVSRRMDGCSSAFSLQVWQENTCSAHLCFTTSVTFCQAAFLMSEC